MIIFLRTLDGILAEKNSADEFMVKINNLFSSLLPSSNVSIFFYDEVNNNLKAFQSSESTLLIKQNPDYKSFLKIKKSHFILNDEIYGYDQDFVQSEEKNIIYLPLIQDEQIFGIVKITTKSSLTKDILNVLIISTSMVSSMIINHSLHEKMDANITFYQSMKNIAKVIENQYEPDYIIPIIGEILDKFVSEHLIYIFKKDPDDLKLLWPLAYTTTRLQKLKEQVLECNQVTLINEGMTGIFPLIVEGRIIGYIVADSNYLAISDTLKNYLEQLSYQTSVTMDKADIYAEILKNATIDSLTGLYNRGQFDNRLKQEIATAKRTDSNLCCIMLDIDFFKKINDTYGHATGDFALKEVSKVITQQIRENDIASRYGGEEFVILLPFTTIDEAKAVAERIRKKIEEKEFKTKDGTILHITISLGLSIFTPEKNNINFQDEADKALYQAKHNGRNQLIIFG